MKTPEIIHLESTISTNDDVAKLGRDGASHLTCVMADFQEKGRGRRGNSWVAPAGQNLLFSILLRLDSEPMLWSRVPQIAGMELIHSIENQFSTCADIKLKWPNDLYYCDMKLGGILVESKLENDPFAILGIGLNCFGDSHSYPDSLQGQVTTLEQIFATSVFDRAELLKSFLVRLGTTIDQFVNEFQPVVDFCNRRDYLSGRKVAVLEGSESRSGIAAGINHHGHLLVQSSDDQLHEIRSGTVTEIG